MLADVKEWLREEPRQALALGISAVALILSFLEVVPGPVDPAWLAVLLCGVPIIKEGAEGLFTRFDIKADVLVSMALLASVIIGEIFAAGEVAFIMQLGALLEERTVAKARAGIERLVHLTPRTARPRASSPPKKCAWTTCCACCPARPSPWTASSSAARRPSTSRS